MKRKSRNFVTLLLIMNEETFILCLGCSALLWSWAGDGNGNGFWVKGEVGVNGVMEGTGLDCNCATN